jgi:DNA-binding transcriptional MocR family regulator
MAVSPIAAAGRNAADLDTADLNTADLDSAAGAAAVIDSLSGRLGGRTGRALAQAVSTAIADGVLIEGAQLPPIRAVAAGLGLSPSTVSAAWALLARAGTIHAQGRRGTTVAARHRPGPARYRRALQHSVSFDLDLSSGVPDPALLPDLAPALRNLHRAGTPGSYLDDPIIPGLAEALRAEWPYPAEHLTIVDGAMDALDQVASCLLRFGDVVVVENPSFPPLLDLLDALGVRTVGVDVDDDGIIPGQLAAALAGGVKAIFLQPRAHNPTGASLTPARARILADLLDASKTGDGANAAVMVVEDDSAGSVASTPPISLGQWLPDSTVHVRSFSKSHGPDLRLAAVSGPAATMEAVAERRLLGQGWTSRLLQGVLLDLLTRRASRDQVDEARRTYAGRRSAMVATLAAHGVEVGGADGLNIWLPVRDETAALLLLASRGIGAAAGSPFATRDGAAPHLRVTAGLVASDFEQVAATLAEAALLPAWSGPR